MPYTQYARELQTQYAPQIDLARTPEDTSTQNPKDHEKWPSYADLETRQLWLRGFLQ